MQADRTPRGDEAELFRRLNSKLVRELQAALSVEQHVVDEAAQFAWLQLYSKQPERENIGAWLFTVARHEALRILAKDGKAEGVDDISPLAVEASHSEAIDTADTLRLLDELKPSQRLALGLLAAGYSYREIADYAGKTYTWVNRHAAEGRAALRKLIEEES